MPYRQAARRTVAYTIADNHVQNHLPIYLIYLPDMKLLHRSGVMSHLVLSIDNISIASEHLANSKEWHAEISSVVIAETEYAILSHRWLNKGELSFRDLTKLGEINMAGFEEAWRQSRQGQIDSVALLDLAKDLSVGVTADQPRNGIEILEALAAFCSGLSADEKIHCGGLVKLVEFCVIAAQHESKYVWMDTCCIDRSHGAELEESIRSMFRWYRNAKISIVHLADTHTSMFYMRRDAWFTGGWTLQQLLAPKSVKFFNANWCPLTRFPNDKVVDTSSSPLWNTISDITGIDLDQLLDFTPGVHNIREIMVWASKRQTTRVKDAAYSLIGMLDVPLSIAYGEGPMAFYRLQREIAQRSPDTGIFAWQGEPSAYNSMFAASPQCFLPAEFHPLPMVRTNSEVDRVHAFTNSGIRISLSLYKTIIIGGSDTGIRVGTIGGNQRSYVLEVQGVGTISVVSGDALLVYDYRVIAILGDGKPGKSLALLLGYHEASDRYKRIATNDLIWLNRLQRKWGPAKTIYIN